MKFDVDDKNRCGLVCVKFHLNRCRFAVAVGKCLGGSLFWDSVVCTLFGRTVRNLGILRITCSRYSQPYSQSGSSDVASTSFVQLVYFAALIVLFL